MVAVTIDPILLCLWSTPIRAMDDLGDNRFDFWFQFSFLLNLDCEHCSTFKLFWLFLGARLTHVGFERRRITSFRLVPLAFSGSNSTRSY